MSTIDRLAVVGAGFMGSGIAESAAAAGVAVTVYEPDRVPGAFTPAAARVGHGWSTNLAPRAF